MRTLFVMSLICAVMSLLAVLGFSAMTFVPGAESTRVLMMAVAGFFAVAWLGVAFWARPRQRVAAQSLPPLWLRRLLVCVSVVYLLGVFFLVIG